MLDNGRRDTPASRDWLQVMIGFKRAVLSTAIVAVALAMAPTSSEAAWWPWQKRDKQQQQQTPDQPVPITPPGAGDGAPAAEPDPGDRLLRIEAQMRTMTGQIEELTFQVRQLQQQLQVQGDADTGAPRKAVAAAPAAPAAAEAGVAAVPGQPAQVANMANAAPADAGPGAPPQPLGRLTLSDQPPSDGQPVDLVPMARGTSDAVAEPTPAAEAAAPKPSVLASLGDPRADYERAYAGILSGDYDQAERGFRQFLSAYPDDARAADAQYWLGESLFERGRFCDAANEFLNGHKAYPKSDKGADTLLKLGLSLAGLGERDAACSTYAQVLKQYPRVSNALRTRIANEQASASC